MGTLSRTQQGLDEGVAILLAEVVEEIPILLVEPPSFLEGRRLRLNGIARESIPHVEISGLTIVES